MASSSLLKTLLHKTIADGLYKEVLSRTSKYYYFLGKTLTWEDELAPPYPTDSFQYEKDTRNEIITLKEIKPSDVAFVVPRINWITNTVYDIYDDNYSTEVIGVNITNGGSGYTSVPTITISAPDLVGGVQATATAEGGISGNELVKITMTNKGSGYTNAPTVTVTGGGLGSGAVCVGVLSKAPSGAVKLEEAKFYVMTDEFNVYKCLDNNNNGLSTVKPIGTQVAPIDLNDGYKWKYMFNVPIALRTKFLTDDQMPVLTALTQQFYSAGGIESTIIESRGSNYNVATLTVSGDGYLEADPVFLSSTIITTGGTNYADGDTLTIAQPIDTSAEWLSNSALYQGNKISSGLNIYEVIQAGISSNVAPTHKNGIATNGTATLKYLGTTARAFPTFTGSSISTINLIGGVREVNLTASGNGYTSNPTVTFSVPNITFNCATAVNTSTETITLGPHWFNTGDRVIYSAGDITGDATTVIGGLVDNTQYYVIRASSTTIKLALSSANAIGGTAINLSSTGVGDAHKIASYHSTTTAFAELSPVGAVKRIRITDAGDDYVSPPSVTIGNEWKASTAVTIGQQYFVGPRLYTVTTAGTTSSTTGPVGDTIGTIYTNGTAAFKYVGLAAKGNAVLRFGAGYDTNPRITANTTTGSLFSASLTSTKSNSKLIPIIENGQIVSVQVDDAGVGYSSAAIAVSGDGSGAVITPDISIGNINTLQANNELLTPNGTINNIQVISKGYSYGTATVTVTGDGTGAAASAVIVGGAISKIVITNEGSGYTYANVTITGNGKAASARAIISPYGGHGKDAYEELFSRTLMFYSNVSRDKNQGFDVNNDYRQVGIIKNLRNYGSTIRYASSLGTACWSVEGVIDTTKFKKDMLLTTPRVVNGITYQRRYRIVSVTSTGALLQVLDNDPPQISDRMTNDATPVSQYFSVRATNAPTVDKYSGDLLFIDNKAGFTPSADETVTLRTVIKF
jgi:hypothetical protein